MIYYLRKQNFYLEDRIFKEKKILKSKIDLFNIKIKHFDCFGNVFHVWENNQNKTFLYKGIEDNDGVIDINTVFN